MKPTARKEVRALLATARGDRYEALYVLAVTTGMRQGEIFALRWADVDLSAGSLSVRGTLTRDEDGHRVVGEPKTRKSRRRIDLGPSVVALLRRHKPNDARGDDFVFVTEANTPIDRTNFRRRHYTPLLKAAKLKPIRFHDLRHTAATLMLANGTHPKVVQERLRHETEGRSCCR